MIRELPQVSLQATERPKDAGSYEVTEAADYLRITMPEIPGTAIDISSSKLMRWIRHGLADPALVPVSGYRMVITFEDLISMRVISFMRLFGISFPSIHRAHSWLKKTTGHDRPFATEVLWLEELGAMGIYTKMENILAVANRGGQLAFSVLVKDNLIPVHNMTFGEFGIASSWSPDKCVKIDPTVQFGRPCIAGTRIPTSDIAGMFWAGDSLEFLSSSYGLPLGQIESAIAWEEKLASR